MRLAHEIIKSEAPVTRGGPGSAEPVERTLWFVHGLLGRGRNWRSMCKRLVAARPWYRGVLLDLRCHGDSGSGADPHDLKAAAGDLADTAAALGMPDVVIGHSLGGKVTLEWLRSHQPPPQVHAFVLDAPPGAAAVEGGPAAHILRTLRTVPVPALTRDALRAPLVAAGLSDAIVAWLLTSARNNKPARNEEAGWNWLWDLDGAETLLASHRGTDFWPYLRATDRSIHLVRGGLSDAWSARDLESFAALSPEGPVRAHVLQDAAHWVHADDPNGTFALLVSWLERASGTL